LYCGAETPGVDDVEPSRPLVVSVAGGVLPGIGAFVFVASDGGVGVVDAAGVVAGFDSGVAGAGGLPGVGAGFVPGTGALAAAEFFAVSPWLVDGALSPVVDGGIAV
jgi:hypothetical protein